MVDFKKYEGSTAELVDLGTVKAIAGKGGKLALIRKNFNDGTKRVAVILTNAKGESATVSCSSQVSKALREKQLTIAQLAWLHVVENEEGVAFVSMPATGGLQEFAVNSLKEADVEVKAEFLPAELIAF